MLAADIQTSVLSLIACPVLKAGHTANLGLVKQAANAPGGSGLAASNQLTLGYNLARAKEAMGSLMQAAKEYQEILAEFPEYLDCYFRLAWISRTRGNHADALHWAEKALEVKDKDPDALALIGEPALAPAAV